MPDHKPKTIIFEFGFGYYVDRKSWSEFLENYNLAGGHLWLLVLAWIAGASLDVGEEECDVPVGSVPIVPELHTTLRFQVTARR